MPENNTTVKKAMIAIIALIIIGFIAFFFLKPMLTEKELPKPVVIDTQSQPTMGNPKATIHFVAFEDLKCSNCARFNKELMPYIQKHWISTGKATYTMINLAFINGSMPAANAAHCIYTQNSQLFFEFTHHIFLNQPPEDENWATVPNLLSMASQIKGINVNQLAECMIQSPYDAFIQNNLKQAMTLMHGTVETPTIYINGVIVKPLTQSQIERVIKAVQ